MSGQAPWSRGHHAWHPTFFPGVPDVCHVSVSCSSEDLLKASRMSLHPGVTVAKYCRLAGWTTARGLTGEGQKLSWRFLSRGAGMATWAWNLTVEPPGTETHITRPCWTRPCPHITRPCWTRPCPHTLSWACRANWVMHSRLQKWDVDSFGSAVQPTTLGHRPLSHTVSADLKHVHLALPSAQNLLLPPAHLVHSARPSSPGGLGGGAAGCLL
nr:uncharacterized protein LOC108392427 isoform X2 [Manis javanica]